MSIRVLVYVVVTALAGILLTEDTLLAQSVSDRVLSRSEINEDNACAALTVYFNIPVRYVSHFPVDRGDELRIRLTPIGSLQAIDGVPGNRESLRPPRSRKAKVRRIEFEADGPDGAALSLYFDKSVYYGVQQGEDFRSIVITISGDKPLWACTGAASPAQASSPRRKLAPDALYVLNLMSSTRPIAVSELPPRDLFAGHTLYMTRFEKDGQTWYRLRVGFFASRDEAREAAARYVPHFGEPWVTKVEPFEREQALAAPIYSAPAASGAPGNEDQIAVTRPGAEEPAVVPSSEDSRKVPLTEEERKLLADARAALQNEDYATAIRLLTKLRQMPGGRKLPDALELLGLARERNRQLAHAKAEYEAYLEEFPAAEGASRVRQRLAALLSVGKEPPEKLRAAKAAAPGSHGEWRLHGSLSQTYTRDETSRSFILPGQTDPNEEILLQQNQLSSVAHIIAGYSSDRYEAGIRFSGSYTNDFRDEADGDDKTINSAYLELADNQWNMNLRVGRQPRSSGGILGRFDGGLFGFQLHDHVKFHLAAGYPVLTPREIELNDERQFYGASMDIGEFVNGLETTWYYIKQFVEGLTDREAVGIEARYASSRTTAFATVDYDLFFGDVNLALFNGTLIFGDNSTVSLSFDYRKAPLLTTYNALLGQTVTEFLPLLDLYTEEEIHQLALDRTALTQTATIAFSKPLTKHLQINTDVLVVEISGTPESGGVLATPGSGPDYFVSTQLIGSSVIKDGDIGILGLRYQNMTNSERYFLDLNGRYPITRRFRINPRFRLGYRQDKDIDFTQLSYKPSIRLDYFPWGNFALELEVGAEWLTDTLPTGDEKASSQFVNVGYRLDF